MEKLGEFRESLKKTDWAWIAGFLDGEGCMTIQKGYAENKKKCHNWSKVGWYWYRPRLSLHNTDEKSVMFIASAFACKYYKRKETTSNLKPLYYIDISAIQILRRVILDILPYLKVKKVQAELVYRLACLPRGSGFEKEQIWQEFDRYSRLCGQKNVGLNNHSKPKRRMLKRRESSFV